MRKFLNGRMFLAIACGTGLLAFFLITSFNTDSSKMQPELTCDKEIETSAAGELLWETVSQQFVSNVSGY